MNFLSVRLIVLFATLFALSRAEDLCSSSAATKRQNGRRVYETCSEYIAAKFNELTMSQIRRVGKSSNVCRKMVAQNFRDLDTRVNHLNNKYSLIEVLPLHCLKDAADRSDQEFNEMWGKISENKEDRNRFFRSHKDDICSSKRRFKDTAMWDKLEKFCDKRKDKNNISEARADAASAKRETEQMRKEREELAAKLQKTGNGQESKAVVNAIVFLPILAALLFF